MLSESADGASIERRLEERFCKHNLADLVDQVVAVLGVIEGRQVLLGLDIADAECIGCARDNLLQRAETNPHREIDANT